MLNVISDSYRRSTSEHSPLLLTSGRKMWQEMTSDRPILNRRSASFACGNLIRSDSSISVSSVQTFGSKALGSLPSCIQPWGNYLISIKYSFSIHLLVISLITVVFQFLL